MISYKAIITSGLISVSIVSCNHKSSFSKGAYGYDVSFFRKNNIEFLELKSDDGKAKLLIAPGYQGRVMTSTAGGDQGDSYGWINHQLLESEVIDLQFNSVGGEERFWLGPEGGPYSLYFKPGAEQVFKNWDVPALLDTEHFDITSQNNTQVQFTKKTSVINASGTIFDMNIKRTISLMDRQDIRTMFGIQIPETASVVAYQTDNQIKNTGNEAWTKKTGIISIWLLCMFAPTPSTTVFIPFQTNTEGFIVNDDYFGKVPSERLTVDKNMIYFKIDGKFRSKIGVPANRAAGLCGSYDSDKKLLTVLSYSMPQNKKTSYVNSKWGHQENPYNGDVINAYNDGITEDGKLMGPFYEIETSSPGAELEPGESLNHIQRILHIQADEQIIGPIVQKLLNLDLKTIILHTK